MEQIGAMLSSSWGSISDFSKKSDFFDSNVWRISASDAINNVLDTVWAKKRGALVQVKGVQKK